MTTDRWNNDPLQFARLLAEIRATQDHLDVDALCESMDLQPGDIDELFERADAAWEKAKAAVGQPANATITVDYAGRSATFELDGVELSTDSAGGGYLSNASRGFIADEVQKALIDTTADHPS